MFFQRVLNNLQRTRLSCRGMHWLLPGTLVTKLFLFLCLPVCRRSSLLMGGGGGGDSIHMTARKPGPLLIIQCFQRSVIYAWNLPYLILSGLVMVLSIIFLMVLLGCISIQIFTYYKKAKSINTTLPSTNSRSIGSKFFEKSNIPHKFFIICSLFSIGSSFFSQDIGFLFLLP